MSVNALLYHGLPAVLRNDYWIVVSSRFDKIARIPDDKLNDTSTRDGLAADGFFEQKEVASHPSMSMVTLITTSACNLRCKYCFVNSGDTCRLMPTNVAFAAIRKAVRNAKGKQFSIAFFGGEPTLTPRLIGEVVAYARKQAVAEAVVIPSFSITTNGVMSDKLLRFLIRERFVMTVSADGPPEVQDYQRPLKNGGRSSPFTENTIRTLAQEGCEFKVRATVTDFSVRYLRETVEWLHGLGGTQLHVEPLSIAGRAAIASRGEGLQRPSSSEFAERLKEAIIRGNQLGVGIINSSYMNLVDPPLEFCEGSPQNRFAVTYHGDVTTCVEVQDRCHPVFPQFIVGRYDQLQDELVMSKKHRERACLVNLHTETQSTCVDCFAKRICAGGCPVRNFHVTGDSAHVDPYRCDMIREMVPFVFHLLDDASEEAQ